MLERLLFGALLIAFLQVPILSDHYIQYLAGYISASQNQVDQLNRLASENSYSSTRAMIESLKHNTDPIVRQDASNKLLLLQQHEQLKADIHDLKTGHYIQRLSYLMNPKQYSTLSKVLVNFKPSIPLKIDDLMTSAGLALLFSLLIGMPFALRYRSKRSRSTAS